jgi:hypothetical protein
MKCPHCEYEDVKYTDDGEVFGSEGKFYTLPIKLEREEGFHYHLEKRQLYGCPNCDMVFMAFD